MQSPKLDELDVPLATGVEERRSPRLKTMVKGKAAEERKLRVPLFLSPKDAVAVSALSCRCWGVIVFAITAGRVAGRVVDVIAVDVGGGGGA